MIFVEKNEKCWSSVRLFSEEPFHLGWHSDSDVSMDASMFGLQSSEEKSKVQQPVNDMDSPTSELEGPMKSRKFQPLGKSTEMFYEMWNCVDLLLENYSQLLSKCQLKYIYYLTFLQFFQKHIFSEHGASVTQTRIHVNLKVQEKGECPNHPVNVQIFWHAFFSTC